MQASRTIYFFVLFFLLHPLMMPLVMVGLAELLTGKYDRLLSWQFWGCFVLSYIFYEFRARCEARGSQFENKIVHTHLKVQICKKCGSVSILIFGIKINYFHLKH